MSNLYKAKTKIMYDNVYRYERCASVPPIAVANPDIDSRRVSALSET